MKSQGEMRMDSVCSSLQRASFVINLHFLTRRYDELPQIFVKSFSYLSLFLFSSDLFFPSSLADTSDMNAVQLIPQFS